MNTVPAGVSVQKRLRTFAISAERIGYESESTIWPAVNEPEI